MDRILRNTGATIQVTFYLDEGAADADASVTVTITREDGSSLVTDAPTDAGTAQDGTYAYTLAPQADLDILTATWTADFGGVTSEITTVHEIIGARLATVAEIRAMRGLEDSSRFSTEKLREAIAWAEDQVEDVCGSMFVPRYARDTFVASCGGDAILLEHLFPLTLQSVTIAGEDQAALDTWRLEPDGTITPPSATLILGDVEVKYEHGWKVAPTTVRWAARQLARFYCLDDVGALQIPTDFGLLQPNGQAQLSPLLAIRGALLKSRLVFRGPEVG